MMIEELGRPDDLALKEERALKLKGNINESLMKSKEELVFPQAVSYSSSLASFDSKNFDHEKFAGNSQSAEGDNRSANFDDSTSSNDGDNYDIPFSPLANSIGEEKCSASIETDRSPSSIAESNIPDLMDSTSEIQNAVSHLPPKKTMNSDSDNAAPVSESEVNFSSPTKKKNRSGKNAKNKKLTRPVGDSMVKNNPSVDDLQASAAPVATRNASIRQNTAETITPNCRTDEEFPTQSKKPERHSNASPEPAEVFAQSNPQPRRSRRMLTTEDRELFLQIEKEWREEDIRSRDGSSLFFTILWTPVLIALRCLNIWLAVVTWPFLVFCRVILGWNVQSVSIGDADFESRKQMFAVACFVMTFPCVVLCYAFSLVLLLFPLTTIPMALYYVFIFYYDKSPETGSRRPFLRYWKFWRHFSNYFPLRLIRTQALDPTRKYVFAYHPHGIISVGAFGNFATNATGFSRKFPGIDLRLLTLEMNFWCPWIREFFLYLGICSVSKRSCNQILSKGPGSSIMLVVGGAAESLDTEPGTYRLTVDRKGFVRVALDNGADLIPVLGFGENDVFDTIYYPRDTWARRLQESLRRMIGFAIPVFKFVPHRKPIIVVVGKPVQLPALPAHLRGNALVETEEGRAIVDKYHLAYLDALRDIWDMYKNRWAVHRAGSLLLNVEQKPASSIKR